MSESDLSSVLDECISQLQKGATLEQVLSQHPEHASELRPLLETSAWMHAARNNIQIPRDAQARSRMSFISQAYQPKRRPSMFPLLPLRLAATLTIVMVLIIAALLGTSLVSAEALPGDALYPVKLALEQFQLNLASSPVQRLQLQQDFDERRVDEVDKLKDSGRQTTVTFTGVLEQANGQWQVAGINLDLNNEQSGEAAAWTNLFVQVTGKLEGMTVHVTDISLNRLIFTGQIQSIQSNTWLVDGVTVVLAKSTSIAGDPVVGSNVKVTARREQNGQISALSIQILDAPSSTQQVEPGAGDNSELTAQPSSTESGESNGGSDQNKSEDTQTPAINTPTIRPTHSGGDDENKSTSTGELQRSPTPTNQPQPGDNHEDPTRTSTVTPDGTPTSTPTPTLTPTLTTTDQFTQTTRPPDDEHRSTRTPTPTQTHD